MALARNVLIFHSGALGDFVLSFPVALALARLYPTSRVRYVTAGSKGRLASRVLGVEWTDAEAGFSGLYGEGAEIPESVTKLVAGSHRVVSFVAGPGDVWARRVKELAPSAAVMHLRTTPEAGGGAGGAGGGVESALRWVCRQCAGDRAVGNAVEQIVSLVEKQGLVRRPWGGRGVLMHPGAGSEKKCWPIENFRELAVRLKSEGEEVRWVLGEVERERLPSGERRALETLGDVIVPGDYVGLLEELLGSAAFVGNDSGPGHLSAMSGVTTLSLFGPTDPGVWGPVGPSCATVRAGGGGEMAELPVERVYAALKELRARVQLGTATAQAATPSQDD